MFEGKVAVVTGASRGIGRAVAEKLAAQGAAVIMNYRGNAGLAEEACRKIREKGGKAESFRCDVSDEKQCNAFLASVVEKYGRIDILVNNAGVTRDGLLMRMPEEDFDSVIGTNLKGTFHTMRFVSRQMLKQRYGRIINMASVVGVSGNAGQTNYAASKAGVIGLTKAAAKELAPKGITVNAIAPGFIKTDMTNALSDKVKEETIARIPLGVFGEPQQVAAAAAFLASEDAGYITGQVLHVDGGMVM